MLFLLHLNEDFDDDLLQDAIEMIDWSNTIIIIDIIILIYYTDDIASEHISRLITFLELWKSQMNIFYLNSVLWYFKI